MPTPRATPEAVRTPGRLIALEGVDGSGKSTHARLLGDALGAVVTAEPGGTSLGVHVRGLLLDPALTGLADRAEALLMAADRAQHVAEVVAPALAGGRWVVTDRFSASTLVYQGYGRGLDLEDLRRLVAWAAAGTVPDLTVLLDVAPAVARARLGAMPGDRLERLDEAFHRRVAAGYAALAAADPAGWAVVDGTGSVQEVAARVLACVAARFDPLPAGAR